MSAEMEVWRLSAFKTWTGVSPGTTMHVDECPRCGKPGYATVYYTRCGKQGCRCVRGYLHGPYLVVRHYTGYDREDPKHTRRTRKCYIPKEIWKKLMEEPTKGRHRNAEGRRERHAKTETNPNLDSDT